MGEFHYAVIDTYSDEGPRLCRVAVEKRTTNMVYLAERRVAAHHRKQIPIDEYAPDWQTAVKRYAAKKREHAAGMRSIADASTAAAFAAERLKPPSDWSDEHGG